MSDESVRSPRRVLDPIDRVSEILFGLIMVLTFTCSISAAHARREVGEMLIAAISCNLAWGLVDAVMYLMSSLIERGRTILTLKAIRKASDPQKARGIIARALPPAVVAAMQEEGLETIRRELTELPEPPPRARLTKDDWLGALLVFLLVFLSTFPVVLPFIFVHDVTRALRYSNLIAILMLFATGFSLGRHAGARPWLAGLTLVVLGVVLVAITMALGG